MCGIAGYILRDGQADPAAVKRMCDQIRHRGPDDEGFHVDGGCALGMRRLSIIDLSTGHQPISNEDGSLWVVFNGEIYNFQSLRSELAGKGHAFRTNTDTEVLVHLYEEAGVEGIQCLRGMFAFAIWDAPRRRLLLARDRFGKKPLYYSALADGLWFGSELKCLRAAGVPLERDDEGLRYYFRFGYIPDPYSAFREVRKLPPGSWLVREADGTIRTERYWHPPVAACPVETPPSQADMRQQLRDVFDESVRIRMIADVPLGAFLSGGIDSSLVVASMALQSREPVKTFSIGFEESGYNELPYASLVAKRWGTDHHEILVRPDSIDLVSRLVRHFDEPFGDPSAIPTFIVSEFAARHVKVALSGDGGDELFAGYERFAAMSERLRRLDRLPAAARGPLSWLAGALPYSAYGKNWLYMVSRESALARYLEIAFAPHALRKELLRREWMLRSDPDFLRSALPDCLLPADADILSQAMYFETAVNLPGDMLVKVDRMSMANSLEVRCPMLDQELAGVAAALPPEWLIRNGKGKQFLVESFADRLPAELLDRPKWGFAVPLKYWFRTSLKGFLHDHLTSRSFLDRGYVSPAFVMHLLDEHESGRRDNETYLWSLLMLELWHRELEN